MTTGIKPCQFAHIKASPAPVHAAPSAIMPQQRATSPRPALNTDLRINTDSIKRRVNKGSLPKHNLGHTELRTITKQHSANFKQLTQHKEHKDTDRTLVQYR